jgi:PleD family two-component response regulator
MTPPSLDSHHTCRLAENVQDKIGKRNTMAKKRLLVIEDDSDVAEMLYVYFISQGYEVYNALTGHDGVSMARAKSPNLILLDVMLPDMDGFDVCRALRTTTLTKYIPITFLTQRDRRADKVAGLELGADDYITKPFDIEELRLRVQASLRRAGRETPQDVRTGLPTAAMMSEMRDALQIAEGWAELDVRIPGFRQFRDKYGFVAADEALAFAGRLMVETIAEYGTTGDVAGMYADDRFALFTFTTDLSRLTTALKIRFAEGIRPFYTHDDAQRGFMIYHESHDDEQFVPLMTLAISKVAERPGVPPDFVTQSNPANIASANNAVNLGFTITPPTATL